MDSIAIDISALPDVATGQRVTLLGRDHQEQITVEELAAWQGTVPYEIFTQLGERVPKYPISSHTC
jgi:alanine racemase